MKKKYFIIIIICLVLIIGGYFGYKCYYYFKYVPDALKIRDKYINGLKIYETINIKTKTLNSNDYFYVNNIKIRNDFKDFELSDKFINDENAKGYILKDSDSNPKTAISLGKDTLFNIVESLDKIESLLDAESKTNVWVKDYIKNLNINNDLDLLMHIINNKDKKPNIFSSKHDIIFYAYEYIVLNLYPIPEKITLIEGDLSGYILEPKELSAYEVHLFNGLDEYVITFWNKDYFTYDYIKELLSTIVIGKLNDTDNNPNMNISLQKTCEYIRTFRFIDYYNYKGNVPEEFYIILDQYQSNNPFIERLSTTKFEKNFIKNQNYEITYKTTIDYKEGVLDESTQMVK